jgi:hypothetical protein
MKIKVDFVTNSSSEVFGVVLGDSLLVGGILGGLAILLSGCKEIAAKGTGAPEIKQVEVAGDAEAIAQEIAKAALEDARKQEEIVKDAYREAQDTLDSARTALQKELDECRKTWEESEKTSDKTDPGYANYKKQYEDYMDYLKSQIEQTEYQKQMVEYEKAQKQAEMDSKNEWVQRQQADYIAVKEEKAMLEAVARGYDLPGYNTDSVNVRLKQLQEREKELSKVLSENGADIDYTARDRGSIGPSPESKALNDKIIAEKERFERESEAADAAKRAKLEEDMKKNIEEYEKQMARANRFDMATKAAEGVQFGADIVVEGLSHVTGPAGQQIKLAYTAGKAVASGMGEGMADPKNAAKHLAKGILNAGTEVLKEKFGGDEKPWQAAATGILNEGLQSGLDASIKGEDVAAAMGKGLTKGVFDAGADKALDKIKDKLPIPKGSSVEVGDYSVSKILNNNPLSKGLVKTVVREGGGSKIKDAVKGQIVDSAGKEGGFADPE